MIDVGQSITQIQDKWEEFLRRDVHNILSFFNHQHTIKDFDEVEERTYQYILTPEKEEEHTLESLCEEEEEEEENRSVEEIFDEYLLEKI